jgi:uncharacterized membrane protein
MNEQEQQIQQVQQQETPPPNYLVFAILTTIFCCQVFGIVSIIFAAMVNSKWGSGDKEGALKASKNAKTWAIVALVSGIAVGLIFALLSIFGIFAGIASGGIDI